MKNYDRYTAVDYINSVAENGEQQKEPEKIDIYRFFDVFRRNWKLLIILVAVCALINIIIHPATTTTVYGAKATVYIPPYTTKQVGGKPLIVTNNVSQLPNAIGLIQTKVYQDTIAQKLGVNTISDAGSYQLFRKKDTDIVEFTCTSSSLDKARELCEAVLDTFNNETIQEASMSEAVVVNPVAEYSNVTATSTFRSLVMGALAGMVLYSFYCMYRFITDKKFRSKEEAQEILELPVLSVIPEDKRVHR